MNVGENARPVPPAAPAGLNDQVTFQALVSAPDAEVTLRLHGAPEYWQPLTMLMCGSGALSAPVVPVGGCGAHSLIFTGNYGPYSGSGSTLASTNGALAQSINGVNYMSQAFIAIINAPTSDATNVTFTGDRLVVTTPHHAPGTVDILVSCGSKEATVPHAFTFVRLKRRIA